MAPRGSGGVSISIKADLRAIDKDLRKTMPDIVAKAQAAALNTTITRIKKRAITGITNSARFEDETIIRQRTRVYMRAKPWKLTAGVFVGLNPVPIKAIGASGSKASGITARGKLMEGAFGGTGRKGHSSGKKSFWERTGSKAYPIKKTTIPISGKAKILQRIGDRVLANDFRKILNRSIIRGFKKYGRTL